jgi:hypothetical protein
MDAPGATEAADDVRQDRSDLEVSVGQDNRESSTHRNPLDRLVGDEDDNDDDEEEDQDNNEHEGDSEEEEAEEEDDEEEPHLKYAYLTKHMGAVYRNGDATSSFLAAGDKLVWYTSP